MATTRVEEKGRGSLREEEVRVFLIWRDVVVEDQRPDCVILGGFGGGERAPKAGDIRIF